MFARIRSRTGSAFASLGLAAAAFAVIDAASGGGLVYLQRAGFRSITTHRLAHDIQNNWYVVMK